MAAATSHVIAVMYAARGGLGDVGKFAAAFCNETPNVELRAVSVVCAAAGEGDGTWVPAEVDDEAAQHELTADMARVHVTRIDVDSASMSDDLSAALSGVTAVISCAGSRQSQYGRWMGRFSSLLVAAMDKAGVKRLVQLSSMGIGDDFLPMSFIKILWGTMLRTVFRAVRADLTEMERVVQESGLDFLLVRPMGVTPSEQARGSYKIVKSRENNKLRAGIAKQDVARFLLEEALVPTLVRTAVTIGQPA